MYSGYLLHVLQKRSTELRTAYQRIAQFDGHSSSKTDVSEQTHVETDEVAIQSLPVDCDECCVLRETTENVKQELLNSVQTVADRDSEIVEVKQQLVDAAGLISELRARADAAEAARKVNEDQVEELEELVIVCKSEFAITEQQQNTMAENSARENELLRSELVAMKARLEAKEEALTQNMLEKDDVEDANERLHTTITSLQHQLDELRLQSKNQNSQFEVEIHRFGDEKQQLKNQNSQIEIKIRQLEDENHQLMEKMQNLSAELVGCQQSASVTFSCSQQLGDLLASQQSCSELSAVKLELLTVQAEKDDLIQQLDRCRSELSVLRSNLSSHTELDSKSTTSVPAKLHHGTGYSGEELESQNAALLGQLLVLEDQLSESEVLLQESTEQRGNAVKELADVSAHVASLEQDKARLETELGTARTNLEASETQLRDCRTQLSLVEGKLSSAGNRQRQLMCKKQQLESQNRELLQKLQHMSSLPAHSASDRKPNCISNKVKENDVLPSFNHSVTGKPFQQTGQRQMMHNTDGTSECLAHLINIIN